jgi:hypothetical protein
MHKGAVPPSTIGPFRWGIVFSLTGTPAAFYTKTEKITTPALIFPDGMLISNLENFYLLFKKCRDGIRDSLWEERIHVISTTRSSSSPILPLHTPWREPPG